MSSPEGKIAIKPDWCKGCGLCIWVCPKKSIRLAEEVDHRGIRIACFDNNTTCTGCGFCYMICPDVAIEVYK